MKVIKSLENKAIFLKGTTKKMIKIIKSLKWLSLLIKGISETIKNEAKEQQVTYLPMLIETLAAGILGKGTYISRWRKN